jgi:branched-chain amino acid transport system substrate-binding protein
VGARAGVLLVAGLSALSLIACGGASKGGLVIYTSNTLSGSNLADRLRAEEIALAEAHGRAGRFVVSLKVVDNSDPHTQLWGASQTRANARQAASDPHAIAFIDSGNSGASAVAAAILNQSGILQVSPASTYPGLTRRRGAAADEPERYFPSARRTFARISRPDQIQAAVMIEALRRRHLHRVLIYRDHGLFGYGFGALLDREARRRGLEVLAPLAFWAPSNAGDHTDYLGRLVHQARGLRPQAIVIAGDAPGPGVVDLSHAVPDVVIAVGDCCSNPPFAKSVQPVERNVLITGPPLPDPRRADVHHFLREFHDRFGTRPDDPAVFQSYEAMRATLDAIRRSDGTRASVVRAFFAIRDRESVLGRYSIDRFGDPSFHNFGVYVVRDGRLVYRGALTTG